MQRTHFLLVTGVGSEHAPVFHDEDPPQDLTFILPNTLIEDGFSQRQRQQKTATRGPPQTRLTRVRMPEPCDPSRAPANHEVVTVMEELVVHARAGDPLCASCPASRGPLSAMFGPSPMSSQYDLGCSTGNRKTPSLWSRSQGVASKSSGSRTHFVFLIRAHDQAANQPRAFERRCRSEDCTDVTSHDRTLIFVSCTTSLHRTSSRCGFPSCRKPPNDTQAVIAHVRGALPLQWCTTVQFRHETSSNWQLPGAQFVGPVCL